MHKILGLDIGTTAVKGVLLDSAFRGYSIIDAATVPVAPGELSLRERQMLALQQLLSRGWSVESSLVAFPGATVASHLVTLPFSDVRRIEQTVQYEVEGQIPFDLTEVSWDWQPLGTRSGKTDLYVGVVHKTELTVFLADLANLNIDPRTVIIAGPAYASLFGTGVLAGEILPEEGTEPPVEVVLDISQERVSVCVVSAGQCEAARTFPGGSGQLRRVLARDLGLTPIVRELRATLKAWEARVGTKPVARLLLAGEAARLPGLSERLASEISTVVEPIALTGPVSERIPSAEAPEMALALALALRGHQGSHAPRFNLRRGDLSYVRDFQHLRGKIVRLGIYAGLVLVLALISVGTRLIALARQESLLDKALCSATQKVVGRCFDDFSVAESVLKGRGTPAAAIPRLSAVDVLTELAARTPADVKLRFDRIEITRDKLHLVGTTDAAENVDRIVGALRNSRCYAEARSGGARKRSNDGKFEFSIDSDISCDGSSPAGRG